MYDGNKDFQEFLHFESTISFRINMLNMIIFVIILIFYHPLSFIHFLTFKHGLSCASPQDFHT